MTIKILGHIDDLTNLGSDGAPDCECSSEQCHGNHHCSGSGVVVAKNVMTGRRVYYCQRCAGREEMRDIHSRDPEKSMYSAPGKKNPARRAKIGRRKTVKTSATGLISRRNRRKVKSFMFRMNQKAKLLACHACSRNDFATEKSLKAHTSKFHTPGQKSPRGFRTARDPGQKYKRGHSRVARGSDSAFTSRELGALRFAFSEGQVGPGCDIGGRMTVRKDTLRMLDRKGLLTWASKHDGEDWYQLTSRGRALFRAYGEIVREFRGHADLRSLASRYRRDA